MKEKMKTSNDNIKDLIQLGELRDVERLIDERPELLNSEYNLDDQYSSQPYLGKGSNKYTPLLHAALLGKADIVAFFLSKQTDYSKTVYIGADKCSVLDISIKEKHWSLSELLIRQGIIERYVYKIDVIASNNREVAQLLFTELAISRASMLTPDGIPNRLIDVLNQGLNINLSFNEISTRSGDTILTYAARNNLRGSVEQLITRFRNHVDIQKLVNGEKAWKIAKEAGHFSIVKILFFSEDNELFLKQNLYNSAYLRELQEFLKYISVEAKDNDSINQFWELIITSFSEDSVIEVGNRKLLLFMQLVSNALNERQSLEELQTIECIRPMLGLTEKFLVFHGIAGRNKSAIEQGVEFLNHQPWSDILIAQAKTYLSSPNHQALAQMVICHNLIIKISEQHILINKQPVEIPGSDLESKLSFVDKLMREISIQYITQGKFPTAFEHYTILSNIAKWQLEIIRIDEERNPNSSKYFLVLKKENIFRIGETRIYKIAPNLETTTSEFTFPKDTNPINNHFRKVLEITIEQQEFLLIALCNHQTLNLETIAEILIISVDNALVVGLNLREWHQSEFIRYHELMRRDETPEEKRFLEEFVLSKQQEQAIQINGFKISLQTIAVEQSILFDLTSALQTELSETASGLSYRVTDLERSQSSYKAELEQSLKQYCKKLIEGLKKFPQQNAAIWDAIRNLEGSQQKLLEKFAKLQPLIVFLAKKAVSLEEIIANHEFSEQQKRELETLFDGRDGQYNKEFYHYFVQSINAVYLASSVISTGIVQNVKSGNYATLSSIIQAIAPHIPFAGIAVQICVAVLAKLNSNQQKKALENFFNIVTSPNDIDEIARYVAQSLLKAQLDNEKLHEPQSLLTKLLNVIKLIVDNISDLEQIFKNANKGDYLDTAGLAVSTAVSADMISLESNQQSNKGKKHSEVIATLLISKIYNGEVQDLVLTFNNHHKAEYMLGLILTEFEQISETATVRATEITMTVIDIGRTLLPEEELSKKTSETKEFNEAKLKESLIKILSSNAYRSLIDKPLDDSQLSQLISNLAFEFYGDHVQVQDLSFSQRIREVLSRFSIIEESYSSLGRAIINIQQHAPLFQREAVELLSHDGCTTISTSSSLTSPIPSTTSSSQKLTLKEFTLKLASEVIKEAKQKLKTSESDDINLEHQFIKYLSGRLQSGVFRELSKKASISSTLENDLVEKIVVLFTSKENNKMIKLGQKFCILKDEKTEWSDFLDPGLQYAKNYIIEQSQEGSYYDEDDDPILIYYVNQVTYNIVIFNHKNIVEILKVIQQKSSIIGKELINLPEKKAYSLLSVELAEEVVDRIMQQNFFLCHERGKEFIQYVADNYDQETLEKILTLGRDFDIAQQIIDEAEPQGIDKVVHTLLGKEVLEVGYIYNLENIISTDEFNQLQLVPNGILNSWSNKPYLKIIEYIDNLAKNLDNMLNVGKSGDQVAIIITLLEEWLNFAASGQRLASIPYFYHGDDDEDYPYAGESGSSGEKNHNNYAESFASYQEFSVTAIIPFCNETFNITDYLM